MAETQTRCRDGKLEVGLTKRQQRSRLAANRPSGVLSRAGVPIINRGWTCFVCLRPLTAKEVTLHHLVPEIYEDAVFGAEATRLDKQMRLNVPACTCYECHRHLHLVFDNEEMATVLNTVEAIRDYPGIAEWAEGLQGRPALTFEQMKNNPHECKGFDPTV